MKSIRILIVTHAPLAPEFGAGQMALNLAEAFREQGHDVTLWSPHPLPPQTRWWQRLQNMRSKLNAFLDTQSPFDAIDTPAIFITRRVRQAAPVVVARSVQPDILYIANNLNWSVEVNCKGIIRLLFSYSYALFQVFLIVQGWHRATSILCLGTLELQWMKKYFPWWRDKLGSYVNALSKADQEALTQVRLHRQKPYGKGIRFLWIGRWVPHKGIDTLLDFIGRWAALHPQDTFAIAGCGTEAEKTFSSELLQSGRVKILPSFERSQIYSLLTNHDVGLFTSKVEGWGLVLNEMLESGMPVFATSVGGVADLQPFCKEILQPFPPSWQLIKDVLSCSTILADYYNTFTWKKIAEKYEASILTRVSKFKS